MRRLYGYDKWVYAMGSLMVALSTLCISSGCQTTPAIEETEANPYLTQGRIQYVHADTQSIVKVVRVDTQRTNGELLKIYLDLRNITKDNLFVDIRTTFLDDHNHILEQTNWESIMLQARTVNEYTCTSLSNQAADYQIMIAMPDKSNRSLP